MFYFTCLEDAGIFFLLSDISKVEKTLLNDPFKMLEKTVWKEINTEQLSKVTKLLGNCWLNFSKNMS